MTHVVHCIAVQRTLQSAELEEEQHCPAQREPFALLFIAEENHYFVQCIALLYIALYSVQSKSIIKTPFCIALLHSIIKPVCTLYIVHTVCSVD